MKKILSSLTKFGHRVIRDAGQHFPLLIVISVALLVVSMNVDSTKWYSGWDNLHGEFDLWRYTNQILGGAWLEHQGLGAPMNLAHLAEITRLPFLWLLSLLVPTHLIRISFIALMYVLGGISMYVYLSRAWLNSKIGWAKNWLAMLGGILYLLHILTLQQFYIAFEMFTVQFAFLPLLFLIIHRFTKPLTAKTILMFAGLQFLLAPSGHTPTNFYLAVLASQLYGFFLVSPKGWLKAFKTAFLIGLLTLIVNSYWIVPNLYYTLHDARYVQESHDNRLFAPESVSSIREAGTMSNFLQNRHYLFEWRDYNFASKQLEFIFNDWQSHLNEPMVVFALISIGVLTVIGLGLTIFRARQDAKRWAIILIYLGCASFIWLGLFPTGVIFEQLYKSGAFTEAFRNPFTKLSIIYCFVSVILFISTFEVLFSGLEKLKVAKKIKQLIGSILLAAVLAGIIYSAWPTFGGHLISEKLQIKYPTQYQELFSYLKTRDQQLRILPLPQLNHAGWEYYDWQFLGEGNGYQGMGFYFFGVPQPVLHRDSDRWVEASDFFYHELKYALDSQDVDAFERVVEKYQVDLILIDETRVEPGRVIDFSAQHQLAKDAGFEMAWQQDFLSIYQKISPTSGSKLFIPETVTEVKTNAQRVIYDPAFRDLGTYLLSSSADAEVIYPFTELLTKELNDVNYGVESQSWTSELLISEGEDFLLSLPETKSYSTPVQLLYQQGELSFVFPQTQLTIGDQILTLPAIANRTYKLPISTPEILVIFNNQVVSLAENQAKYQALQLKKNEELTIRVAPKPKVLPYTLAGTVDGSQLELMTLDTIVAEEGLWQGQTATIAESTTIKVETVFPVVAIKIDQNPSQNCSEPKRGSIETKPSLLDSNILYVADDYGVNCNGLELATISSWGDYLLRISGENKIGRGIKFFLNRSAKILTDDYIFSKSQFDTSVTVHSLATPVELIPTLNWETRSFGKTALSSLNRLEVAVLPLQQLAGISLKKNQTLAATKTNHLEYQAYQFGTDTFHVVKLKCEQNPCVLGLDQSYDSAWIAAKVPTKWWSIFEYQLLPHARLNTWSNGWQLLAGESQVVIWYWPEVVSLFGLTGLVFGILLLVAWTITTQRARFIKLAKRTKLQLLGQHVRKN